MRFSGPIKKHWPNLTANRMRRHMPSCSRASMRRAGLGRTNTEERRMSEHPSPVPPRTPAAAQPSSTYQPTPDEEVLIRLSQEWMHVALVEKDERRLRSLMAPEF